MSRQRIGLRCAAINAAARLLQAETGMTDDQRVRRAVDIAGRLEAWLASGLKPEQRRPCRPGYFRRGGVTDPDHPLGPALERRGDP